MRIPASAQDGPPEPDASLKATPDVTQAAEARPIEVKLARLHEVKVARNSLERWPVPALLPSKAQTRGALPRSPAFPDVDHPARSVTHYALEAGTSPAPRSA